MKQLSEVLKRMEPLLTAKEPSSDISNTLPLGSISEVGSLITQSSPNSLTAQDGSNPRERANLPAKQRTALSKNWVLNLESDDAGKAAIASFLVDCFNALNTYGATPDQIQSSVKMHILLMGEYPLILVRKAYLKWLKTSSKQPTPSDIIAILEEDNGSLLRMINRARECSHYPNLGLAEEAYVELEKKLGKDWRKYV